MRVSTSKSKNAESLYITKSFINEKGESTSKIIRKLGTLKELSKKLGTDRDGVMEWAKEQADIETLRYKENEVRKTVLIPFHSDRQIDYGKQIGRVSKNAVIELTLFECQTFQIADNCAVLKLF